MSGTEKTIDQFGGWEEASQQHDFFGETNLVDDVILFDYIQNKSTSLIVNKIKKM